MPKGVQVLGPMQPGFGDILTPGAVDFLAALHRTFNSRRLALLQARQERQAKVDAGAFPDYDPATQNIRDGDWTGPSIPKDLQDRRVEITGPTDRKMVINALNSGAKVFMADFEDANCPTWTNGVEGQMNLRDAIRGTISFHNAKKNKTYRLNPTTATLMVRPRGWHLNEAHIVIDGEELSGSLFDFGLYFYHNAKTLLRNGSGPYFYLPKLEAALEARLWNEVFNFSQDYVGIPRGTIRATCLLETILAAFEMDEIIYELRTHSAGLNCGRWDYIFSSMKVFRNHARFVFPDRSQVGMDRPFMNAYVRRLVRICHRRKVHAMGGMSAFIPARNDPARNKQINDKITKDKLAEVRAGHDGSWIAHPALLQAALKAYDQNMPGPNQIFKQTTDDVASHELLPFALQGTITEKGLRTNVSVAMAYMEAYLRGVGCIPVKGLMEDAATAEISRTQVWQWIKHGAMCDGQKVTKVYVQEILQEETEKFKSKMGADAFQKSKFGLASSLLMKMLMKDTLDDFMTSVCYPFITRYGSAL